MLSNADGKRLIAEVCGALNYHHIFNGDGELTVYAPPGYMFITGYGDPEMDTDDTHEISLTYMYEPDDCPYADYLQHTLADILYLNTVSSNALAD